MTMTLDTNQQQRFGHLNFDHMSSYSNQPHFTNPWVPSSSPTAATAPHHQNSSHGLFSSSNPTHGQNLPQLNLNGLAKPPQHDARTTSNTPATSAPLASYPVTAVAAGSPLMSDVYGQQSSLGMPQDLLSISRIQHPATTGAYTDASYTTAASPVSATYAASPAAYDQLGYAPAPLRGTFALAADPGQSRRYSQSNMPQDDRRSFQDALEASHGMLSMSQETPRNIYDVRQRSRGSGDAYGFPSSHSTSSSVSSTFSGYYGGSVDSSVSDYSTAGSDIESLSGRSLPRLQGLMTSQIPPAPQSMMGQFSSKVSSSTQKKHKCKVCDKRFTRPSSLQTHMYSHTGEKPFACEVEGCGRHFSVVSNLRRHRKVHKGQGTDTASEAGSEDHHSDD